MADDASGTQRRTFRSQFLTFRGRSNRANFWLTLLVISIAYTAILFATLVIFSRSDAPLDVHPAGVAVALINFAVFVAFYALAVIRRLHDRGRSAHWLWLFAAVPVVLNVVSHLLERQPDWAGAGAIPLLLALPIAVWGVIEFGFLRGTIGPNRFGPEPLAGNRGS